MKYSKVTSHHVPPRCYGVKGFIIRVIWGRHNAYNVFFGHPNPSTFGEAERILAESWRACILRKMEPHRLEAFQTLFGDCESFDLASRKLLRDWWMRR